MSKTNVTIDFKVEGKDTPTTSTFIVKDGENAFEAFTKIKGNEQKTIEDFFEHIRGKIGTGVLNIEGTIIDEDIEAILFTLKDQTQILIAPTYDGNSTDTSRAEIVKTDKSVFTEEDLTLLGNSHLTWLPDTNTVNDPENKAGAPSVYVNWKCDNAANTNLTGDREENPLSAYTRNSDDDGILYGKKILELPNTNFLPDYVLTPSVPTTLHRGHFFDLNPLKIQPATGSGKGPYTVANLGMSSIDSQLTPAPMLAVDALYGSLGVIPPTRSASEEIFEEDKRYWVIYGEFTNDDLETLFFKTSPIVTTLTRGPEVTFDQSVGGNPTEVDLTGATSSTTGFSGWVYDSERNTVGLVGYECPNKDIQITYAPRAELKAACSDLNGNVDALVTLKNTVTDQFYVDTHLPVMFGGIPDPIDVWLRQSSPFIIIDFKYVGEPTEDGVQSIEFSLMTNQSYYITLDPDVECGVINPDEDKDDFPLANFDDPVKLDIKFNPGDTIALSISQFLSRGQSAEYGFGYKTPKRN